MQSFADTLDGHRRILIKNYETVSFEEIMKIAESMGVGYGQAFVLPDGEKYR